MIEDNVGFVYLITNTTNDRKYIGKKLFWTPKTKMVNKKKKKFKVESDWKEYYGSNKELASDVELLGLDKFKRVILTLCKSRGSCSYHEAKLQFECDAMLSEEYYNTWIMVRVHKKHMLTSVKK
jgi:hypothetical protein